MINPISRETLLELYAKECLKSTELELELRAAKDTIEELKTLKIFPPAKSESEILDEKDKEIIRLTQKIVALEKDNREKSKKLDFISALGIGEDDD